MKNFLLGTVGLWALAAPAIAADLPVRAYGKASVFGDPGYNWSGFYAGANAGYGWGRNREEDIRPPAGGYWTPVATGSRDTLKPNGGVYGGQISYNWQVSNWVLGAEFNWDGASLSQTKPSFFYPTRNMWSARVSSIFTADARLGYALGTWLPYLKGGYAAARLTDSFLDTPTGDSLSHSGWQHGWNVGVGVEYMLASNWIVGLEYNYLDFGNRSWNGSTTVHSPPISVTEAWSDRLTISTLTAHVSYKLGSPVVARY
jgi:outer membrane immunogenic protein